MKRIVVIGGGITGCAAAYEIARRGHNVRLFERHQIAAMASGWTLGGVRQSGRDSAELPLARAAVALWPGLADILGHDTGYVQGGNLRLAREPSEVLTLMALVETQRALGLDLHFLPDSKRVRSVAAAVSDSVIAASYCASDGFADPVATTRAFAHAAEGRDAQIETGCSVRKIVVRNGKIEGVETSDGFVRADGVVLAAGIHTPALLAPLGLALPLDVTLVQVVQTEPAPLCFEQVFGVANADCAGRQEPNGRFRFTSGLEPFRGDPEHWTNATLVPSAASVEALRAKVATVLPAAAVTPVAERWGGLIDLTPDHLPVIDAPASIRGLVVAAGFSGHGFGIGPMTGRLAADLALGEAPCVDPGRFRLDRFAARTGALMPLALHG